MPQEKEARRAHDDFITQSLLAALWDHWDGLGEGGDEGHSRELTSGCKVEQNESLAKVTRVLDEVAKDTATQRFKV